MSGVNPARRAPSRALAILAVGVLAASCSSKGKEADKECVDPPEAAAGAQKTVKVERYGLGKAGDEDKEDKDWCRACVMSKLGYASCQRVFAGAPGEDREAMRARARSKACADAKYPEDACPDQAVINIQCKGEPPPPGTPDPGTALQNLFQSMGGSASAGGGAKPEAKPEAKTEAASEPSDKPTAK